MGTLSKILKKVGKILGITLLVLLGILLVVILLIRTEWAQNRIVGYATNYVSDKTNTRVDIDHIYITFRGNVQVEGLYAEDLRQDTLVYFKSLEAGVGVRSLLDGRIDISRVDLNGLRANVTRIGRDSSFNFDYIINAFTSQDSTTQTTPDTSSSPPPTISVGPVHFQNFRLTYLDSISGIDAFLKLGKLELSTDDLDLEKSRFALDEVLLENTQAEVKQFLSPPPSEDTTSSPMPYISFDEINLRNIEVVYESLPDSLDTRARIGKLGIGRSELALAEQDLNVEFIRLIRTDIRVRLPKPATDTTSAKPDTASPEPFTWPAWKVQLAELVMEGNHFEFHQGTGSGPQGLFDPAHLGLRNLELNIQDLKLEDRKAQLEMEKLVFIERSGFSLNQLGFEAQLTDEEFGLKNLNLKTRNSELNAQIKLGYPNIDSLLNNPQHNAKFGLAFGQTSLSVQDAYYFSDSLRFDSIIQNIESYPLQLRGGISGSVDDLSVDQLKLNWLNSTRLLVDGEIQNITDSIKLSVAIPQLQLNTSAQDLGLLLNRKKPEESLPRYVNLNASVNGNAQQLKTKLTTATSDGYLKLDGSATNIFEKPTYQANLKADSVAIGKFAQNPSLQPVSFDLKLDGQGKTLEELQADLELTFRQLIFKDYNYNGLALSGDVKNRKANLHMDFADPNLVFDLDLDAFLDTVNARADLTFNLQGADLKDLNLTPEDNRVATLLNLNFKGNPDKFKTRLTLKNNTLISGDDNYRFDSLFVGLANSDTATDLNVSSAFLEGELHANTSIQKLSSAMQAYLKTITAKDSTVLDSSYKRLDMNGRFRVVNTPLLSEILVPNLERMDTVKLEMAFKPSDDLLRANLSAPDIKYGESVLNGLYLDLDASRTAKNVSFGFNRLTSGPIDINTTALKLNMEQNSGQASLSILDTGETDLFYAAVDIEQLQHTLQLHVNPEKLLLNTQPWGMNPQNQIRFEPKLTRFKNFELSRNNQKVSIESFTEEEKEKMRLAFSNFKLESIFSILNSGTSPVSGTLGGNVKFIDLTGTPAFVADVDLQNLGVMGQILGTLNLEANNRTPDEYVVDMSLKGKATDLDLSGKYSTAGKSPEMDLKLDLNRLDVALVEAFAPKQVQNASGYLTANFTVQGTTDKPDFEGALGFKNVNIQTTYLGTGFKLGDEKIEADNEGVYFKKFTVTDDNGNHMVLDGELGIRNMINPNFDLSLKASKFQVLNSTREDNDLVYGTGLINLDVTVKGDLDIPKVDARVELIEGTNISYIVPPSQAQLQERQGIVRFANMKDSLDILSSKKPSTETFTGLDIEAYLKIDPKTTFNVIIDEQSGDQLTITGEANLNFNMATNGNMNLNGSYELSDGSYQLSLYQLVKKKFNIAPGSRIEWSGDPMGAELDLTAIYKVETAPADLMAYQVATQGGVNTKYNQQLPFEVMLYIDGTLRKPQISFGLDMPESSRNAFGGSVYTQVRQLNEDEAELNKQVFALIVFNRFLPSDQVDGGGGVTSELARSSVSKLLSSQLNKISEKYIKGVELNFDVDSYTDYQTGTSEQRTDLNVSLRKSLFDERVVVEVGSSVGIEGENNRGNEIVGDVSVEYLITENGRYRLRAFRKEDYEDLVTGQVTITGLAILFNKEFDTLEELFQKPEEENNDSDSTKTEGSE